MAKVTPCGCIVARVNGIDCLKLFQPYRVLDRHQLVSVKPLSAQRMTVKNFVVRSTHFCAETPLEFNDRKFLA